MVRLPTQGEGHHRSRQPVRRTRTRYFITISSLILIHGLSRAQGYYPLQVGNLWEYWDYYEPTYYGFTTRVTKADTIMPNGMSYTMLVSDRELDTLYFRQSGLEIFNFSRYWHSEELWYDFSKAAGDTVTIRYYPTFDTVTVTVIYSGMASVFGVMRWQWGFEERSRATSVYAIREVTDSVGLTYYQYEPGITYSLRGAMIAGKKYGTTNVVLVDHEYPKGPILLQNYPNPFNGQTEIEFTIPQSGKVTLEVFNILGERIATILDGVVQSGRHTLLFTPARLATGTYFYRLIMASAVISKRMLYIK